MLQRTLWGLVLAGLLAAPTPAPGFVSTDSLYLKASGKRVFVIGSYNLPPGITLTDLREAGFNFAFQGFLPDETWGEELYGGVMLGETMALAPWEPPGPLIDTLNVYKREPGLLVWHAPDEPAWQDPPVPADEIERGYGVIRTHDPIYMVPHPVWLNHAARGTRAHPDSFELLAEYNSCADIFSFDIYPVPSWFNGSILPDKEITSVGAYTEIMIDLLRSEQGRQTKPVWMVLQAFAWTDFFFSSAWLSATRSEYDFDEIVHAAAGDFTGDGRTDMALLFAHGGGPTDPQVIYVAPSNGQGFDGLVPWVETTAGAFDFNDVSWAAAGDLTGDGRDDLVLLYNNPSAREKFVVAPSLGHTFDWYQVWLDTAEANLDHDRVYGFETGDFDGDLLEDVALAYSHADMDQAPQVILMARSLGDSLAPLAVWHASHYMAFPLNRVRFFRAGDYDGDELDDLAFFYDNPDGRADLQVSISTGASFGPRYTWWDSLAAEFPPDMTKQLTRQDLNGDGKDDLAFLFAEADTGDSPQWVISSLSDGASFNQERWGVIYTTSARFMDHRAACGGDFNNDGLGDFCVVHDYTWPWEDPRQRLEVSTSYGDKFGWPGPTAEETRFMAYDAVINGATGIVYWGLFFTGGPYDVWQGVSQTASELAALQDVLILDDSSDSLVSTSPAVELRLKEAANPTYCLLAANASDVPAWTTISGAPLAGMDHVTVVFEGRTVTVTDSSFTDAFQPYEVHVYAFGLAADVAGPVTTQGLVADLTCHPSPFTHMTSLRFTQPGDGRVDLAVYDIEGRLVRRLLSRELPHGAHVVDWDGRSAAGEPVPTGVYFCRLRGPGIDLTEKLLRLR